MFPIVNIITSAIFVVTRLVIAVQLTLVARRQKLPHLLWLAAFFYFTGIADTFLAIASWTNQLVWPWRVGTGLGEIMMVMFIQKTFYQDRKSPFLVFMALALGVLAADIFYAVYLPYHSPFNWLWLIVVGYQAYKRLAADPAVDDWVKGRYKLVIAYSALALVAPSWTIADLVGRVSPAFQALLYAPIAMLVAQVGIMVFTVSGLTLQYLAWVMPGRYRKWLNRNYQSPVKEEVESGLTEEEIMRKLQA